MLEIAIACALYLYSGRDLHTFALLKGAFRERCNPMIAIL